MNPFQPLMLLVALNAPATVDAELELRRPYCGIYALYAGARLHGKSVDFSSLLVSQFVSSPEGSTAEDLLRAAREVGLHARLLRGLTSLDLRSWDSTAILHVKADSTSKSHDHWVLLVRCEGNDAVFLSAGEWHERVPLNELRAIWDGVAIVLATGPISDGFLVPQRMRYAAFAVALSVALSLGLIFPVSRRATSFPSALRGSLLGMTGLAVAAAALGTAWHRWNSDGLLRNPKVTHEIQSAQAESFFEYIDLRDRLDQLMAREDVLLIDSRGRADYARGHIAGAVNIPMYSSEETLLAATSQIDRRTRLVIYCQSRGCPFSVRLGSRLREMGFERIAVFRPGWVGWKLQPE